jgi:hypothetical protein
MNFQEMEALARAPQERVNLHMIEKLESIEGNQLDASLLIGKHDERLDAQEARLAVVEKRAAKAGVKLRLLWSAFGAGVSAAIGMIPIAVKAWLSRGG